jgi:antirestriction protein ArdC
MKKSKSTKKHIDVYSIVNERIIQHLEKGVIPWRQPWTNSGHPKNLITRKNYRGINVMLLSSLHYAQNYFLTFKQVKELGGKVKQGEKSCPVIYWNWIEKENGQEQTKLPLLRYYNVFNISQCEDIPQDKLPITLEKQNDPIKACEDIISNMPNRPDIRHNEHRAYYSPTEDYINVPDAKTFIDSASYYSTLFHELVHSSGHSSRLNRNEVMGNNRFRSKPYAQEELTAEMGACYLKSYAGIPIENLDNNAAYINNWLGKLKGDKKFIVQASTQAQKATDYILNQIIEEKDFESTCLFEDLPPNLVENRETQLEQIRSRENILNLEK